MTYPYTIDNGAGERITFLGRSDVDGSERLLVENRVSPGAGPPMHSHLLQTEALTVVSGRIAYQVAGQEPGEAGPGQTVVFPAGEPHRFWNPSDETLLCSGWVEPPGNSEFFLGALYESARAAGGSAPNLFDIAFLLRRYRSEFELLEMPRILQRTILPVVQVVGKGLGRYGKYAGAPEPLGS